MKFKVTVAALAEVVQEVEIEAPNAGLAEQAAKESTGDREWKYLGIQEGSETAVAWAVGAK